MSTDICETAEQLAAIEGRDIAAVLNPAPITVIGACDEGGRIGFATVLWAMPVSLEISQISVPYRRAGSP